MILPWLLMMARARHVNMGNIRLLQVMALVQIVQQDNSPQRRAAKYQIAFVMLALPAQTVVIACNVLLANIRMLQVMQHVQLLDRAIFYNCGGHIRCMSRMSSTIQCCTGK